MALAGLLSATLLSGCATTREERAALAKTESQEQRENATYYAARPDMQRQQAARDLKEHQAQQAAEAKRKLAEDQEVRAREAKEEALRAEQEAAAKARVQRREERERQQKEAEEKRVRDLVEVEEKAQASADVVWDAYDRLPAGAKTKEKLAEAIREARTHERGIPVAVAARLGKHNLRSLRRRFAPIMQVGATTDGDANESIVLAVDRDLCIRRTTAMLKRYSFDGLLELGFVRFRCLATTRKSSLTGKLVEDPAIDWPVDP